MRRRAVLAVLLAIAAASAPAPAYALDLSEPSSHVAITVPDGWALSTDGSWALADAPDHLARVRIMSHGRGVLTEQAAEAFLVDLLSQSWGTYTIDKHVKHVTCGRFAGVELFGHGSGDSWDRARFHLFLLVDAQNLQRGAVVLISGRADVWDAVHPVLDRAVHALH